MKGYRFYKEYDSPADKRKDKPTGNVFAAVLGTERTYSKVIMGTPYTYIDGFGSIYSDPNSPVNYTTADLSWLHDYCKRISEAEARKIHPKLFERIEDNA